jgi:hypothetical protein
MKKYLLGFLALVVLIGGFSLSVYSQIPLPAEPALPTAPRAFAPAPATYQMPVGRYQLVQITTTGIIILDTATGELYRADASDIQRSHHRNIIPSPEKPKSTETRPVELPKQ